MREPHTGSDVGKYHMERPLLICNHSNTETEWLTTCWFGSEISVFIALLKLYALSSMMFSQIFIIYWLLFILPYHLLLIYCIASLQFCAYLDLVCWKKEQITDCKTFFTSTKPLQLNPSPTGLMIATQFALLPPGFLFSL